MLIVHPKTLTLSTTMTSVESARWSPRDLMFLWPLAPLTTPLSPCYTSKTFIQGPDQFGGWEVLEKEREKVTKWSIPQHYINLLGIINSKIMWLQSACTHNWNAPKKQQGNLESIIQDCRRNLIFTYNVRTRFYLDVKTAFYSEAGEPRQPFSRDHSTFQSDHLDSWLCVEFNRAVHCPHVYMELIQTQVDMRHPKDIRLEGNYI
jgi:hypothetical protein